MHSELPHELSKMCILLKGIEQLQGIAWRKSKSMCEVTPQLQLSQTKTLLQTTIRMLPARKHQQTTYLCARLYPVEIPH